MNGRTRHPHDSEWQLVRGLLTITGAALFVVAGRKMTGIPGESGLGEGLGIASYGLAVVCLLVGLPQRLAAPDTDDDVRPVRTAAEPAAAARPTCPECGKPVEPQNLAGHLTIAHGLSDDEARGLAGPMG
jgi:hypothetical protein